MEQKTLSTRVFYESVWGEYADPLYHPITAEALATQEQVVAHRIRQAKPRKILDLGCGPAPVIGFEAAPLVVCADLVFEMLVQIRRNRSGPVVCLDARRLPFVDNCFDFIWCGLLIDHIEDPEEWIQELLRVLEAGATLGMACWDRSKLPPERYPENDRMCYTTAQGEEFSVRSFPTWERALRVLEGLDPHMELETYPVVPDEYLLQVAWVRVRSSPPGVRNQGTGRKRRKGKEKGQGIRGQASPVQKRLKDADCRFLESIETTGGHCGQPEPTNPAAPRMHDIQRIPAKARAPVKGEGMTKRRGNVCRAIPEGALNLSGTSRRGCRP